MQVMNINVRMYRTNLINVLVLTFMVMSLNIRYTLHQNINIYDLCER